MVSPEPDLVPQGEGGTSVFWRDQLHQAAHTRARIGPLALATCPRLVTACSSRAAGAAGDDWIAIGDAAAAFDPLSSQGVAWALESGLMAAPRSTAIFAVSGRRSIVMLATLRRNSLATSQCAPSTMPASAVGPIPGSGGGGGTPRCRRGGRSLAEPAQREMPRYQATVPSSVHE